MLFITGKESEYVLGFIFTNVSVTYTTDLYLLNHMIITLFLLQFPSCCSLNKSQQNINIMNNFKRNQVYKDFESFTSEKLEFYILFFLRQDNGI